MNLLRIRRALGALWTQLKSGSGTEGEDCGAVTTIKSMSTRLSTFCMESEPVSATMRTKGRYLSSFV